MSGRAGTRQAIIRNRLTEKVWLGSDYFSESKPEMIHETGFPPSPTHQYFM